MKHIVIINPYFFPGFKAGGPVQSIVNLIGSLNKEYNFSVITSAYDLNEITPYANIKPDEWNEINLNEIVLKCFYASANISRAKMKKLILETAADLVFINGLYSHSFFWNPLSFAKQLKVLGIHTILSPRGMLQQSNLAIKSFKKKPYLQLVKWLGFTNHISWHATDEQELIDIKKNFSNNAKVNIAGNIPKQPWLFSVNNKSPHQLKLVFLSLIAEKKNLLKTIELIKRCNNQVSLDIYGPIKDTGYWQQCLIAIDDEKRIQYKGAIIPNEVQNILSTYDAMILLTKGENFGHAIFESFSVGVPVITSHFTPWSNLQQKSAGWNIDIDDPDSIMHLLNALSDKNKEEWQAYNNGALSLAQAYFQQQNFSEAYKALFT